MKNMGTKQIMGNKVTERVTVFCFLCHNNFFYLPPSRARDFPIPLLYNTCHTRLSLQCRWRFLRARECFWSRNAMLKLRMGQVRWVFPFPSPLFLTMAWYLPEGLPFLLSLIFFRLKIKHDMNKRGVGRTRDCYVNPRRSREFA